MTEIESLESDGVVSGVGGEDDDESWCWEGGESGLVCCTEGELNAKREKRDGFSLEEEGRNDDDDPSEQGLLQEMVCG